MLAGRLMPTGRVRGLAVGRTAAARRFVHGRIAAFRRTVAKAGRLLLVGAVTCFCLAGVSPMAAPQNPAPRIAAAANLNFALTAIADQFAREKGNRVELVFGASGTLTRQIQQGAPFEMFLAADEDFPNRLSDAGLTRNRGVVYATGRVALFAPKGSPLEVDERLANLTALLERGGVTRFAIANPEVAPYGEAAEAVLKKRKLWDAIRPRLVLGDTIAQAAQFASTGDAVGGLIAYSIVRSPEFANRGTYALIPAADHPPLRQRMVLMKRAGAVAAQFYAYMQTTAARAILRTNGYEVPQ
jgi:molybdate transport system substrate-binding protein